jgi:hypothetical protein
VVAQTLEEKLGLVLDLLQERPLAGWASKPAM